MVYRLYLKGLTIETIYHYFQSTLSENDINDIIDFMNDIYN
jgi:hypothetical protein